MQKATVKSNNEFLKRKAHRLVKRAIQNGELPPASQCAECGSTDRVRYHHDDYSKPLDVIPLCPRDHRNRKCPAHDKVLFSKPSSQHIRKTSTLEQWAQSIQKELMIPEGV